VRTDCHLCGRPALFVVLTVAGACADGPVSPSALPQPSRLLAEYECTADFRAGTLECGIVSPEANGARLDLMLNTAAAKAVNAGGGAYSGGDKSNSDTMTYNLALLNLIPQPIGTTDGITSDTSRLVITSFRLTSSQTSATGQLDNADGTGTFVDSLNGGSPITYSNVPYMNYPGLLAQNDTSSPRFLRFVFSPSVTRMTFTYRIWTRVQYLYGYVTIAPGIPPILEPGATSTLTGTVYNQFGAVLADAINWSSSDVSVATVNSSTGQVTAVGDGTATITATSNVNAQRIGTTSIAVDAAPAVVGTTPTNSAVEVISGTDVTIGFNEAVNATSGSFELACPIGSPQAFMVSGSGTNAITLIPEGNLPFGTTCTVTVLAAQVSDVDAHDGPNTMAADYVFSFETGIKANDDLFGETIYGMINTGTTSPPFSVTGNDQLSPSTTISFAGWNGVPGKTQQGGDVVMAASGAARGHFTYDPPAGYAGVDSLEYTIQSGSATSTAKVALLVDADAAPAVSSTTPADGATDATPAGAIVVQFSEPVNVSTGSFSLGCTSGPQPFTISGSGTSTVTLYPISSLPTGDTCTATVLAAGVSDVDVNDGPDQLGENHSFWFVVEGFGG
jgi:hypothetical protein